MNIGGWQFFCVLRLVQGLCQGVMWPSYYAHLAKWCPVEERNRLGGITQTGMDVGTAIGFATSGLLAASRIGWPSMFYVPVIRKSMNSFASWVPAVALLSLGFISAKNVTGSISCLIVAVAAISAQAIGSSLNHIDLAPNYAGLLYGLSDTLMSLVGVLSPIAVSLVVTDEADRTQWRTVYIAIAVILFLGNFFYIVFGEMETQCWNDLSVKRIFENAESNEVNTSTYSKNRDKDNRTTNHRDNESI